MSYDIIIVGAGPAGLACATTAAKRGLKTLVIERKKTIGEKVCAGGITWNGLIKKIPGFVPEKKFPSQFLYSKFQKAKITAQTPIIATINRRQFGQYMVDISRKAGAEIRTSCLVRAIDKNAVTVVTEGDRIVEKIKYKYLVGADGSSSLVRRYLGIPVVFSGVGINYKVPGEFSRMQWHFDSKLFRNGYAWVFPHSGTASIGAYADTNVLRPARLKENLLEWAGKKGYSVENRTPSAEFINYDYRGWRFRGNVFLAGDAAGLASGLTGEGIYPAIISGEAIAKFITVPESSLDEFSRLQAMHEKHKKMAAVTGKSRFIGTVMSELIVLGLRLGLITFDKIEMAH